MNYGPFCDWQTAKPYYKMAKFPFCIKTEFISGWGCTVFVDKDKVDQEISWLSKYEADILKITIEEIKQSDYDENPCEIDEGELALIKEESDYEAACKAC